MAPNPVKPDTAPAKPVTPSDEGAARTAAAVNEFQRNQEAAAVPAPAPKFDGPRTERQKAQIEARKAAKEEGEAKSAAITEETSSRLRGCKPTPTPEEIEAAIRGENVMVKEDDGSGPDFGIHGRALGAAPQAKGYQTRSMAPAAPAPAPAAPAAPARAAVSAAPEKK